MLHTGGEGINFQFARFNIVNRYRLFELGFYILKDPKEQRQPNPDIVDSRPYVFGKLNNLFVLKGNYGGKRVLADRLVPNGIKIDFNYSAGVLAGFLKPQYFQIRLNNPDGGDPTIRDERFNINNTTYQQNTIGNSSFLKGLNQTTFMAGANAKLSLDFEWGNSETKYWSLESGVMCDVFPQEVPIFAYNSNNKYFLNIFLVLSYGSRK